MGGGSMTEIRSLLAMIHIVACGVNEAVMIV
jgi:hypothetical protein